MSLQPLFPTQIWQAPLLAKKSTLHKHLQVEVQQFRELDNAGKLWSQANYPGGYTSYGSMTNLFSMSPYFADLRAKIDKQVKNYASALQMDLGRNVLQMSSLWINIMPQGVLHTAHIHPQAVISGIYYLQLPQGCPGLKFEDPRLGFYMATPPRKNKAKLANRWFVEISPREGEVLLFESWLRHEVPVNRKNKERISLSFNYEWSSR